MYDEDYIDAIDSAVERARTNYECNTPRCPDCGYYMEHRTDLYEMGDHVFREVYWQCPECGCSLIEWW